MCVVRGEGGGRERVKSKEKERCSKEIEEEWGRMKKMAYYYNNYAYNYILFY